MEVAVVADHLADAADVRQQPEPLAHLLPAPADRVELGVVVGQVEEDLLDLLVDRRGEQGERLDGRLLGGERRVVEIGGQHGVELAGHLARAGAAAAGRRRRRRPSCRARAPSRRRRP